MSEDVFVKFEYGAREVFLTLRLRTWVWLRRRPAEALLVLSALGAWAGAVAVGPVWLHRLALWVAALVLVQRAFAAAWAVPHLMFRKSRDDVRPSAEAVREYWSRKMSVDLSEEGIVVTVGTRSATVRWADCTAVETDRRTHVIFHGASGFVAVPRSAFRTAAKDAAFRALAERFLGAARTPSARDAADIL